MYFQKSIEWQKHYIFRRAPQKVIPRTINITSTSHQHHGVATSAQSIAGESWVKVQSSRSKHSHSFHTYFSCHIKGIWDMESKVLYLLLLFRDCPSGTTCPTSRIGLWDGVPSTTSWHHLVPAIIQTSCLATLISPLTLATSNLIWGSVWLLMLLTKHWCKRFSWLQKPGWTINNARCL